MLFTAYLHQRKSVRLEINPDKPKSLPKISQKSGL